MEAVFFPQPRSRVESLHANKVCLCSKLWRPYVARILTNGEVCGFGVEIVRLSFVLFRRAPIHSGRSGEGSPAGGCGTSARQAPTCCCSCVKVPSRCDTRVCAPISVHETFDSPSAAGGTILSVQVCAMACLCARVGACRVPFPMRCGESDTRQGGMCGMVVGLFL